MRLNRFFIDASLVSGDMRLEDVNLLNQWKNVLKLKVGDQVVLIEEGVSEALATIKLLTKKEVVVLVEKVSEVVEKSDQNQVTLYCAILKKDNFELVCQKATEVGVAKIVPVITTRTVKLALNQERLEKIVREASEQSRRVTIPKVDETITFNDLLVSHISGRKIIFDMTGEKVSGSEIKNINILVGPEGGFTEEEIKKAREAGFEVSSLGSNVYRAETAGIVASYLAVEELFN